MALGPLSLGRGVRLLTLAEIDSTNDEAKRLVLAGERGPLWIVSAQQTRGRGRLGRIWMSRPGNLYASLVVSGFGPAALAPQLGFVAGVAVLEAARRATGAGDRLSIKWPNDLLLDGAKAAGVLLEGLPLAVAAEPPPFAAIIGIGVNCAEAPQNLPYRATALSEFGPAASASTFFAFLSDAMVEALDQWREGAGFGDILARWRAGAFGLGGPLRVSLPDGAVLEGRFESIDGAGRLVLATEEGSRLIDAGDVFLPQGCNS